MLLGCSVLSSGTENFTDGLYLRIAILTRGKIVYLFDLESPLNSWVLVR